MVTVPSTLYFMIRPAAKGEELCKLARAMGACALRNVWASTVSGLSHADCVDLYEIALAEGAQWAQYYLYEGDTWVDAQGNRGSITCP